MNKADTCSAPMFRKGWVVNNIYVCVHGIIKVGLYYYIFRKVVDNLIFNDNMIINKLEGHEAYTW